MEVLNELFDQKETVQTDLWEKADENGGSTIQNEWLPLAASANDETTPRELCLILAENLYKEQAPKRLHEEDCGLPENAFYVAMLRELKPEFGMASDVWYSINMEDTEGKEEAAYLACLFDMMSVQLATEQSISKLTAEVDFNSVDSWLELVDSVRNGSALPRTQKVIEESMTWIDDMENQTENILQIANTDWHKFLDGDIEGGGKPL